ncbi:MAG: GNAT family N-acetyltransferase [Parashewanella sp.]
MYRVEMSLINELSEYACKQIESLADTVPELRDSMTAATLKQRIQNRQMLLILSFVEGELAGFKLGYALSNDVFYSWIGGISQDFRQLGLARTMLLRQEQWARENRFTLTQVKTQNCFPAMLTLLVKQGYQVIELNKSMNSVAEHKFLLEKVL